MSVSRMYSCSTLPPGWLSALKRFGNFCLFSSSEKLLLLPLQSAAATSSGS